MSPGQKNIVYSLDAHGQPMYEKKIVMPQHPQTQPVYGYENPMTNIEVVRQKVQQYNERKKLYHEMKAQLYLQEENDRKYALELQAQEENYADMMKHREYAEKLRAEQQNFSRFSPVPQPAGSAEKDYRQSIDQAVNRNNLMFQSESGAFGDMFANLNSIRRDTMESNISDCRSTIYTRPEGIASQHGMEKPILQRDTPEEYKNQAIYNQQNHTAYDPSLGYQYNPSPPVQQQYVQQYNNMQAQQNTVPSQKWNSYAPGSGGNNPPNNSGGNNSNPPNPPNPPNNGGNNPWSPPYNPPNDPTPPKPRGPSNGANGTSLLDRMVDTMNNPHQNVVMTFKQPDYDHIKLNRLTPWTVVRFIEDVHSYSLRHGVTLKATSLINDETRDAIISRNEGFVDESNFHMMNMNHLMSCLQRAIRPNTKELFIEYLEKNVHFKINDKYDMTLTNFQPMYDAVSRYKKEFLLFHNFLEKDNLDTVPFVNCKPGGSIKIFINKIPFEYGMRKYNVLQKHRFTHISEFIVDFWNLVQRDYKDFKAACSLERSYNKSGTTKSDNYDKPKNDERPRDSSPKKPYFDKDRRKPYTSNRSVNHISSQEYDSEQEEKDKFYLLEEDETLEQQLQEETTYQSGSDDGEHSLTGDQEDELNAMDNTRDNPRNIARTYNDRKPGYTPSQNRDKKPFRSSDNDKKPGVCFKMLLHGECDNAKCTYSHDSDTLKEAAKSTKEKLEATVAKLAKGPTRGPGGGAMGASV
jgi:hypothetical protein